MGRAECITEVEMNTITSESGVPAGSTCAQCMEELQTRMWFLHKAQVRREVNHACKCVYAEYGQSRSRP
jgi:hypothetical protein